MLALCRLLSSSQIRSTRPRSFCLLSCILVISPLSSASISGCSGGTRSDGSGEREVRRYVEGGLWCCAEGDVRCGASVSMGSFAIHGQGLPNTISIYL
jgi:hypothetical protein